MKLITLDGRLAGVAENVEEMAQLFKMTQPKETVEREGHGKGKGRKDMHDLSPKVCSDCGQSFRGAIGLATHKRHCKGASVVSTYPVNRTPVATA